MTYPNSKHFVKSKSSDNSSFDLASGDIERDDDDPLSIKSSSIAFLGILIAFLTIFLPSVGVLLGRPLSQGHEKIFQHLIKKDGS